MVSDKQSSMKVLVISPKFHPIVGGGETFVLHSLYRLQEAGIDVSIATEPHVQRRLDAYPFPIHEIPGLSDTKLDVAMAADSLFKLIHELNVDVIHVHGYFGLLAIGLSNDIQVPLIASIHSTPIWNTRIIGGMSGFDQELTFARQVLSLSKPKIIIAANDVYAVAARKIVKDSIRVELMPYPLLSNYYREHDRNVMRNKFSLKDSDFLITLPSRIIERKGIREAIFSLAKLPSNFFLCLPCAITPLDKTYWSNITKSKQFKEVRKRIIIPKANILPEDMPYLYAASDIIIMPSYYEGAPVATIEALASKKPFVGANSQGINNFIRDKQNGLLVPPRSVGELAEAIMTLANNKQMQEKFIKQGQKDVTHLSWDYQLPRLIKLYEEASARII